MSMPTAAKSGAPTNSFCWAFPGSPLRINIPLTVIARLRTELDQRLAGNSSEVGGVLLGHNTPGTLEIHDFVWLASDGNAGGAYSLNIPAVERMRLIYTYVVGYFRTQAGADVLELRDDEIALVRNQFRDPANVVLLIEASSDPHTAGFFFWMKDGAFAPLSFMDFPLDAELLQPASQSAATESGATKPAKEIETAKPVPALSAAVLNNSAQPSIPKEPEPAEKQTSAPVSTVTSRPIWGNFGSRQWILAALVVVSILTAAGIFATVLRESPVRGSPPNAAPSSSGFPLELDVEARGNGLNIRWNPQSAAVSQAREGRLVIHEGDRRQTVLQLRPQDLASGHLYYRSSAERLEFQLEIVDHAGKVSKESVIALSPKPSIPSAPER
jgi:hypothetical protein